MVGGGRIALKASRSRSAWRWRRKHDAVLQTFVRDERGQDPIEYGLLVGVITVGAIVSIKAIGPKVATYFSDLNTKLK